MNSIASENFPKGEPMLSWTGERYLPGVEGQIALEHLHRYAMVRDLAIGKIVLDVACGEGYGSAHLAEVAHQVIGVDVSQDVIGHAIHRYKRDNLEFRLGSCTEIPISDSSIDLVVSFETIEHHDQHDAMMEEIKRVLRPEGVLVISSPEKYEYSVVPNHNNPFHVKELYRHEFENLMGTYFRHVVMYGQRVVYGSGILREDSSGPIGTYEGIDGSPLLASGMRRPIYLIAVGSDVELPIVSSSVFEDQISKSDACQSISAVVTERDGQIASLHQAVAERDGQIASLNQVVTDRGEEIARLNAELKEIQTKVGTVLQSISWKLTLPLREARRWVMQPGFQVRRYIEAGLGIARQGYQSLPLSYQARVKHRTLLARRFPKLLVLSGAHHGIPAVPADSVNPWREVLSDVSRFKANVSAAVALPTFTNPLVSVIIPVYGKIEYTLCCLDSIARNLPVTPFEVIVIDDHSPDNSAVVLGKVVGIRLIRNAENEGFIRSCNIGAESAQGQYVHFLNNDTQVTPGWLDELLRTFDEFPGTGLTGSRLVYPDGRLQEAGGIIWQDASAWNFGRLQNPSLPVYSYAREVDYCSGASIMVPKGLFAELGGFDEHYRPAYCEDSDLAMKIRSKGHRVIYQPLSTVIHYEGMTCGTDTTQGVKGYQIENTQKFFKRWQEKLKTHQAPGTDVDDAKDRRAKHRVLVLDHCTPMPDQDAGSVTVFNLLVLLRELNFQVTFIPEDNFLYMPGYTTALQRVGVEVLYAPYCTTIKQHLKEFGQRYDLVFLFRPVVVERNIQAIRKYCRKAKILYHTIDLHFLRMQREAAIQNDETKNKQVSEMRQREMAAIRSVDASIVHSTAELELLRSELPEEKIHVFPLIMDVRGTRNGFKDRRDIVFVGGYHHPPNVDAVKFMVGSIMPLLRRRLAYIKFYIVGSNPPDDINRLASEDVIITGYVEDLNSLLDKVRVSVAPLRYGAGIKGKIGTAMAGGLPVVATSLATEGMSLATGENILVADGAEAFADAVVRLYEDETLWNQLSKAGLVFADRVWGAEAALKTLTGILNSVGMSPASGPYPLSLYRGQSSPISFSDRLADPDYKKVRPGPNSNYDQKIERELAMYEKQEKVHDLPNIYHYWSNKFLTPILAEAGFQSVESFFVENLLEAKRRTGRSSVYFASIGAGNCDLEVNVAKHLTSSGCHDFVLECVEINPAMLDRGRKLAFEHNVSANIKFVEADFNAWRASRKYDAVIANQSLHHVTELEHLYDQIRAALHEKGSFVISDMIGRNGHQRWPESLEVVHRFWKELPYNYKFNVLLKRHEEVYENWDCSREGFEGVRAQEVLPLLLDRFKCETFIGFGSAIDIFVDRCFGHNFDPSVEWDRTFIDRVHAEDEMGLLQGKLTPTHMMAVFVVELSVPTFCSRGLCPEKAVREAQRMW